MRLEQLLEGISKILYHATDLHYANQIAINNEFRLTPDLGTGADAAYRGNEKKIYFLSTARGKTGSYHFPISKYANGQAVYVLDGEALQSAGFTGNSVDYWGPEISREHDKDELEDRIFSTKSVIPNAKKYILEVHVYFNENDDDRTEYYRTWLRNLTKAYGKRLFVYDDPKYAGLQVKSKAIKPNLKTNVRVTPLPGSSGEKGSKSTFRYRRTPFNDYQELLNVSDEAKLTKSAKERLSRIRYYRRDAIPALSSDIHNAKSGNTRPDLDKFLTTLKKNGLYSVTDTLDFIKDKFPQD